MKFKEIISIRGGSLAEYGRLNYIMGVEWGKRGLKSMGLFVRAEGLIDQNPERKKVTSCTVPVKW